MTAMPHFDWHRPTTLAEAHRLLLDTPPGPNGASLIAGGTDLVPKMRAGARMPSRVVSLGGITELSHVEYSPERGLTIGATARISEVGALPPVREHYFALERACAQMATPQVRNMGTVVGNLANGSPCADTAAPLLVLDAVVEIASPSGRRMLPIAEFHRGPGHVALEPGEIAVALHLPPPRAGSASAYLRHSARSLVDMSAVGVAGRLLCDPDGTVVEARLAISAVAPTPRRCPEAEALLLGTRPDAARIRAAAETCAAAARPIDDVRASASYRRHMVRVLAQRVLAVLLSNHSGGQA